MKNPGPVAQGRALTRLAQENRDRYRRIYAGAPGDLPTGQRRSWAARKLSLECPERYRELYREEKASLDSRDEDCPINPDLIGRSTGPGPDHAVLADGSATVCGRIRFHTYQVAPGAAVSRVTCTYCVDELRGKPVRTADPQFSGHAANAKVRLRELIDLRSRVEAAEEAAFEALSLLQTPPTGTAERAVFAELLAEALGCGLTLRGIGKRMKLSGERIRQVAAEHAQTDGGGVP